MNSGSPFAGSSDHGEPKVLWRFSVEFKFNPSVVRSIPRASDVRSGSLIFITLNKPSKPNGSGVECAVCMDFISWFLNDWLTADICWRRNWDGFWCWYWTSWSYEPMPETGFWEFKGLSPMPGGPLVWTRDEMGLREEKQKKKGKDKREVHKTVFMKALLHWVANQSFRLWIYSHFLYFNHHNIINRLQQQTAIPVSDRKNAKMGTYLSHADGEDPGC